MEPFGRRGEVLTSGSSLKSRNIIFVTKASMKKEMIFPE